MIKKFVALLAALVLLISSAGCVAVSFSGHGRGYVTGEGEIVSTDFSVGDFSEIVIDTNAVLYYTAEKTDKVTIETHGNLVQYFSVSTGNGVLTIDCEVGINTDNGKSPRIYISAPTLERLHINGAVKVENADKIASDSFELLVEGVFNGELELDVERLTVDSSGVSNITLSGTAVEAYVDMSGVGDIEAFGLQTKEAHVETSGVGSVEISCSDKLTAEISSIGGVSYKGDPAVTVNEAGGLGKVTKAG